MTAPEESRAGEALGWARRGAARQPGQKAVAMLQVRCPLAV